MPQKVLEQRVAGGDAREVSDVGTQVKPRRRHGDLLLTDPGTHGDKGRRADDAGAKAREEDEHRLAGVGVAVPEKEQQREAEGRAEGRKHCRQLIATSPAKS